MILDQLMEKKDLLIYIDVRKKQLIDTLNKQRNTMPKKRRDIFTKKMLCRIKELDFLLERVHNIKDFCKKNWVQK